MSVPSQLGEILPESFHFLSSAPGECENEDASATFFFPL